MKTEDELGYVKQKLNNQNILVVKGRTYNWNAIYHDYYDEKNGGLLKWKTIIEAIK
jgi:hypothetical protein